MLLDDLENMVDVLLFFDISFFLYISGRLVRLVIIYRFLYCGIILKVEIMYYNLI